MELFCGKSQETGEYRDFFANPIAVQMCGVSKKDIVRVFISECEESEGSHWAYHDLTEDKLRFIFKSEMQVKMCSPDFFKSKIEDGKGKIVPVKISEIV